LGVSDIALGGHHAADEKTQAHLAEIGDAVIKLVSENKVQIIIGETITLEEVPKSLEKLSKRHVTGKIVVRIQ
jgi:NADPH2:quinone reductase